MLRFAQHLLVYNLLISGVHTKNQDKIVLSDGVTFFQRFNGYSCYWNNYMENFQWKKINNQGDPVKCANLCAKHERCTGFELSYSDVDPYCAFWYEGACGHEEMQPFIPYRYFGPKVADVATYVLMDGNARFNLKQCDDKTFNSSNTDIRKVDLPSESTCTALCTDNNCTMSVAPVFPKKHGSCLLFKDHSCRIPSITTKKYNGVVTTIKYPLTTRDPPFSDAYGMCNPYSEVLRGYRTCAEYASAFPCDCGRTLGDICTNANASAAGGKGYVWKHQQFSTCKGDRLGTWLVGSLSKCKASCKAHSDCGCFNVKKTSEGEDACMLHSSAEVMIDPSLLLGKKSDAYQLTRVSYDPKATLSTLCPAECKAAVRNASVKGTRCSARSDWDLYDTSLSFLLIFTPVMFAVVIFMAIWTYVRRRCFLIRNHVAPPPPPMKKTDIESMETEEFTTESELKYGEIECSICLLNFEPGDMMRVMKCGHRFHKECVDEWLSRYKSVCPLCKTDMRGNFETEEQKCQECPPESEAAGDLEMGNMPPSDSESDSAHNPETPRTENTDNAPQRVAIDQSALDEPLLENEDERNNLIANDALDSGEVLMDMQPIVEEQIGDDIDEEHDEVDETGL